MPAGCVRPVESVARTADAPLLLVCTGRPTFVDVWQRGLAGETIELHPLPPDAIEHFVDALIGEGDVNAAIRERIIVAAEGNPLYAEQIFTVLVDEGIGALEIPPTIHALLASRLDALPRDERAVVEIAAVIGLEFAVDAVEALVPETIRSEVDVPRLMAGLAKPAITRALGEQLANLDRLSARTE